MSIKLYKTTKAKPFLKALIYSEQGVGKTSLAISGKGHPDLDDILVINVDKGELSIRDHDVVFADIGKDEHGISTKTIVKDLEDIIFAILTKKQGYGNFKTIVIDTLTELQNQDMEDIAGSKEAATLPDYGKDTKKLKRICTLVRDVPLNIIITAQVKKMMDGPTLETQKITEIRPMLTSSVGDAIMAAVNFVWYLYVDPKGKRQLVTKNLGVVRGKTRNPKFQELLGDKVEDPNLTTIYNQLLKATE